MFCRSFYNLSAPFIIRAIFIERRVARVEIFTVKIILRYANGIGKALIVNYFSCAQEFYYVIDVGIVGKTQNVVIGRTSFLFCYYHVFATKLSLAKVRKILIFQGVSALLKLTIFQKFQ